MISDSENVICILPVFVNSGSSLLSCPGGEYCTSCGNYDSTGRTYTRPQPQMIDQTIHKLQKPMESYRYYNDIKRNIKYFPAQPELEINDRVELMYNYTYNGIKRGVYIPGYISSIEKVHNAKWGADEEGKEANLPDYPDDEMINEYTVNLIDGDVKSYIFSRKTWRRGGAIISGGSI